MSEAQEFLNMYLWGFIESRGWIPSLVEAYGDFVGDTAALNAIERALEIGFAPGQVTDPTSVYAGVDDAGRFEVRKVWIENVSVNAQSLFEEANDLASAVVELLGAISSAELSGIESAIEKTKSRLDAFDERWQIQRT